MELWAVKHSLYLVKLQAKTLSLGTYIIKDALINHLPNLHYF